MEHTITCRASVATADRDQVWAVWSDVAAYPTWDPREELNRLDGPFVADTTGTFKQRGRGEGTYTITAVDPGRSWTTQTSLPGGRLVIEHVLEEGPRGVELTKRYTAVGPMALAFRLFFARGIRREMPESFDALEAEIGRRFAESSR
jgi:Polyketide cyclase / dehydrase and lipid transport